MRREEFLLQYNNMEDAKNSKSNKNSNMGKDKSSFSVTCSLLSQYLKEKKLGGLGGLGLDMPPLPAHDQHQARTGVFQAPTTMNLMPGVNVSAEEPKPCAPKSMELFPQKAGIEPVLDPIKEENSKEGEKENGQLTIFYGGKVVVFDNFPSDKVDGLLQMVNKEGAVDGGIAGGGGSSPPSVPTSEGTNVSDLPIARRNSLHRFLEKRKDRVSAKGPYQVNGSMAYKETVNGKSWLGLGPNIPKIEMSS